MVALRGSDKIDKYLKKALRERQVNNWQETEGFCKKILKIEPGNAVANQLLGEACSQKREFGKALKHLLLAQDLVPNSPAIQNAIGNIYRGTSDYDKALARYQRALALNLNWPETHFNLGITYRKMGRFNEATRHFQLALAGNPQWADAHDQLARLLEAQGRGEEARKHYQQAVQLDASNLSAKHHLAALTGETPDAPPHSYVMEIFDAHAEQFDHYLVDVLGCQIPALLRQAVDAHAGGARNFSSALDLGCGTGLSGRVFRDVCKHLSGVDIAPRMIEEAKKKGLYDELYTGDVLSCLGNLQRQYDLFIASDLFVYLGNLSEIFAGIAQRAAAGAYLIFSTEVTDGERFTLLPSGRYAHSTSYIEQLAKASNFAISSVSRGDLRKEGGTWITGNIYVLKYLG